MMKSKKLKVIVGICFLVVVIYGIFYVITNWNVKKIAFDDVKNIHINYYANNQSNIPAITVELGQDDKEEFLKGLAKCKFMKRKNPEECRWDGENYKFEEDCDYEVVLDNNTKLKFVYNEEFDDMYNAQKFTTTLYREGEKLDGICDTNTAFIIINCVDKELTNRTKIFQTGQVTVINTENRNIELNSRDREMLIRRTKKIFATQEKIDEEQVEFIVDFNNGTKLQIYKPDNNPTSSKYGTIVIDGVKSKNVEIPIEIMIQIRCLYMTNSY